ncbi:unnamed protein product [Rangifer tarandus platyrhynchus]|uniref:Uncharacterized protein n=1 Tax=Rangifer tarandus platyrhynchus TaxID=3082113 RepID=A0ABN8ZTA7_RANTA|nr:unnamed protein product [Rangifer tarandus platyrhynchus]
MGGGACSGLRALCTQAMGLRTQAAGLVARHLGRARTAGLRTQAAGLVARHLGRAGTADPQLRLPPGRAQAVRALGGGGWRLALAWQRLSSVSSGAVSSSCRRW